jgi:hypothetical protein
MDLLAELRRRLDVPVDLVSDELLTHFLDAAANALQPWLVDDVAAVQGNVDEATLQLAVKLWDTSTRGVAQLTPDGQWTAPAPSATAGLVRAVFGALGPALRLGGVSV